MEDDEVVISYEAPPSPEEIINYTIDVDEIDWQSPVRKQRSVRNPPAPRKRRRTQLSEATTVEDGASAQPMTFLWENMSEEEETESTVPAVAPATLVPSDGPVSDPTLAGSHLGALEAFSSAVWDDNCEFNQLTDTLFITNGWNRRLRIPTSDWYHLVRVETSNGYSVACLCPESRQTLTCLHTVFMQVHGDAMFPRDIQFRRGMPYPRFSVLKIDIPTIALDREKEPIIFSRLPMGEEGSYESLFSVPSPGILSTYKNRVVVEHQGTDDGAGRWKCSKDARTQNCGHINSARDHLQRLLKRDRTAMDENANRGPLVFDGAYICTIPNIKPLSVCIDPPVRSASQLREAVSFQPIPPPEWARIASDPVYPRAVFNEPPADFIFPLSETSSCPCQPSARSEGNPHLPVLRIPCEVYGLMECWIRQIEVQKCPLCKEGWIGPDCGSLGVFNWKNKKLITHELLHDYTASYTTSETPFNSWAIIISRRYTAHGSEFPFLSDKDLVTVWFLYARLVNFQNDMTCNICLDSPRATIWDGVTIAFNKRNILPSLQSPSATSDQSTLKDAVRYVKGPQVFVDQKLRRQLRTLLSDGPLYWVEPIHDLANLDDRQRNDVDGEVGLSDDSEEDIHAVYEEARPSRNQSRQKMRARLMALQPVADLLKGIDASLHALFLRCFGEATLRSKKETPAEYRSFFLQIAAEESVLQLLNKPMQTALHTFLLAPSKDKLPSLNMCPAVFNLLKIDLDAQHPLRSWDSLGALRWLLSRAVFVSIAHISNDVGDAGDFVGSEDVVPHWSKVRYLEPQSAGKLMTHSTRLVRATASPKFVVGPAILA